VKEARNSSAIPLATLPPIFSHYNGEGKEIGGRESERVVEGSIGKEDKECNAKDERTHEKDSDQIYRLSHGKDIPGKSLSQSGRIMDA